MNNPACPAAARYLIVAPQLGFDAAGGVVPGGLPAFGRCVARALASAPGISRLGLWAQVDPPGARPALERMLWPYAPPALDLDLRLFGGSRPALARALFAAVRARAYERVMYLLVNQAALANLPAHPPYDVWEIGVEMFRPLSWTRRRALRRAAEALPGLAEARVVHLCLEPPLFAPDPAEDFAAAAVPYDPAARAPAVFIVGNLHRGMLYKGHQELIAAWPQVVAGCPSAELWIAGDGGGRPELESQARALPAPAARQVRFLGRLDDAALQERYRRCRVFAMPSAGEGFGLVYLEAARFGVPCIGGRRDAAGEIILDGETGLLVDQDPAEAAQACLQLLTDDALAARLGEAGRRRCLENFRFVHFRQRLLSALDLA